MLKQREQEVEMSRAAGAQQTNGRTMNENAMLVRKLYAEG